MTSPRFLRHNPPFCGTPFVDANTLPSGVIGAIFGAGHSLGTAHRGTENGPYFLRTLAKAYTWSATSPTLLDLARKHDFLRRIVDLGDIDFDGATLVEALQAITTTVSQLPRGVAPCVLGGDHSTTYGVVRALQEVRAEPLWVVHFDHHLDLEIWGNQVGEPGQGHNAIFNTNVMSHVSREVGPGRILQIGMAPYATVEVESVDAAVRYLNSVGRQICLGSPELRDEAALSRLAGVGRDIYVSVDVDVLKQAEMSSTNYPAEYGLDTRELLRLIDLVVERNRLVGFDVVEFAAPREARDRQTLGDGGRAVAVFLHLLGWLGRDVAEGDR